MVFDTNHSQIRTSCAVSHEEKCSNSPLTLNIHFDFSALCEGKVMRWHPKTKNQKLLFHTSWRLVIIKKKWFSTYVMCLCVVVVIVVVGRTFCYCDISRTLYPNWFQFCQMSLHNAAMSWSNFGQQRTTPSWYPRYESKQKSWFLHHISLFIFNIFIVDWPRWPTMMNRGKPWWAMVTDHDGSL